MDFIGDAGGDGEQGVVAEAAGFAGHEVVGADGADGEGIFVGTAVAHHADGAGIGEHGEVLVALFAPGTDFLDRKSVV